MGFGGSTLLPDPSYTPSYEELRLAVRILGLKVTVFPTTGEWPYRYRIDVTVPAILAKMKHCVAIQPALATQYALSVMSRGTTLRTTRSLKEWIMYLQELILHLNGGYSELELA
jgi:hypothetical protein